MRYRVNGFSDFLNEKTGINDDVENFSLLLYDFIINEISKKEEYIYEIFLPNDKIPKEIVNFKEVKFFRILISNYLEKNAMDIENETDDIEINLLLNRKSITRGIIEHEVIHLYQFVRRQIPYTKDEENHYKMSHIKSYYNKHKNLMKIFNYVIYFTLDSEIDARTHEVYKRLKNKDVTKENFIDEIKKTEEYELIKLLINSFIIKKIKKGNIVDFVSNWLFFYNNKDYLIDNKNNFKMFKKLYFKIGPIKKPSIVKKYPVIDKLTKNIFYEKVSYKYADEFLDRWDNVFKKQGEKFRRKLVRLYNNF